MDTNNNQMFEVADEIDPNFVPQSTKSAFGYYGCKQRLAPKICEHISYHNCWVDLFCGSAAITMAKHPAPIEIINDIDSNIFNVFKQLRKNSEELIKSIELTPYSREEFENARKNKDKGSEQERARMFLVEAMMSINGVMAGAKGSFSVSSSYSRGDNEARVNRWLNYPKRLESVVERLKKVRVEKVDARELLAKFENRPATLVYVDPPYLMDRKSEYSHEALDEEFHIELLELCLESKAMILVSSYENDLYDEYLSADRGWTKQSITAHTKGTNGEASPRTEVVWKNERLVETHRNGVCIELTEAEEKYRKLNPERV